MCPRHTRLSNLPLRDFAQNQKSGAPSFALACELVTGPNAGNPHSYGCGCSIRRKLATTARTVALHLSRNAPMGRLLLDAITVLRPAQRWLTRTEQPSRPTRESSALAVRGLVELCAKEIGEILEFG